MAAEARPGRVRRIATGDLAAAGADADGAELVSRWQDAIRRVLLVAHLLPAVFGLIAISALEESRDVFPLATACWLIVLAWSAFLAIAGWNRTLSRRILTRWVLADAAVMAGPMFIGTPARGIVSYIAVDGALFAAAFVSTRLALIQIAIVYGALFASAQARHAGWHVPAPLIGWLTPLVVALAGVLALSFIRSALDELEIALSGRQRALVDERHLRARAAQEEAFVRDIGVLEETIAPDIGRLERLGREYAMAVGASPSRQEEAAWLTECVGLAGRELTSLRDLVFEGDLLALEEVVEAAILGAGGALLAEGQITGEIAPALAAHPLGDDAARALSGFVREAVNNAVIHGAAPVRVTVFEAGQGMVLSVTDAGEGYERERVVAGIGLGALEQYATLLGATIDNHRDADGHALMLRLEQLP